MHEVEAARRRCVEVADDDGGVSVKVGVWPI
jgi:hypothetical protein